MKIDTQGHGAVAVLAPRGPLTRDDLDEFHEAVRSAVKDKHGRVVLDFSDVPFIDSAAIEALLDLYDGDGAALNRPRLAQLTDACREALDLTQALARLETFDTVESAIRSYKR